MATTTNYSWSTPDDTALVKDGAAAIRSLGTAIDTTVFTNAGAAIAKATVDAKGDLIVGTADNTIDKLTVGANDTILVADSSTATGLKWAAPAGGGKVLQVVSATYATEVSSSSSTYADTGLTATITPTLNTSQILVLVSQNGVLKTAGNSVNRVRLQLLRGATTILKMGDSTAFTNTAIDNQIGTVSSTYLDSPATTSATTYKTQIASGNNTAGVRAQHYYDDSAAAVSTITLLEIGA
jgi:hypothetical protein